MSRGRITGRCATQDDLRGDGPELAGVIEPHPQLNAGTVRGAAVPVVENHAAVLDHELVAAVAGGDDRPLLAQVAQRLPQVDLGAEGQPAVDRVQQLAGVDVRDGPLVGADVGESPLVARVAQRLPYVDPGRC